MRHRFASTAVILALGLALAGVVAAQDGGQGKGGIPLNPPSGQLKIGVVDLATVFKQYKKSADLEQRINEERDRLRKDLDEQKKVISNLLKELDLLDPDSETYMIKEDEKDAAVARFDRKKKRLEEQIKKRWELYNLQLLDDIEAVVKAYGEQERFTLILKVEAKPAEEARLLMGLRAVLYSSRELDITPAIVDILNRRFEVSGGSPTPAPAPSPGSSPPPPAAGKAPTPPPSPAPAAPAKGGK